VGVDPAATEGGSRRRFLKLAALAAVGASVARAARGTSGRVVIIGGGFAGAHCALQLRTLAPLVDVTLIDPDARYVTCPMSNGVLVGLRSVQSITFSRTALQQAGVRYRRDRALSIDSSRRSVQLASGESVDYERLVVAPGIRFLPDGIEGYDDAVARRMPHAWHGGVQTQLLARQLQAMDDGGVFAICVPSGLMRCPPAPFERASLIANWMIRHKPRSKVLIFDANNHFPRQDVFTAAWHERYPGRIEWFGSTDGGTIDRIEVASMTLYGGRGAQRVAVANVIPRQAPTSIAVESGLASGHGWCPVHPLTFESTRVANVHVIGDACIAGAMPKSASAAVSQADQCARAICALLSEAAVPAPVFESVCYSFVAPDQALAIRGRFVIAESEIRPTDSPEAITENHQPSQEAGRAQDWYRKIVSDSFGERLAGT